jgi:beta-N-acetylhexosaminidase
MTGATIFGCGGPVLSQSEKDFFRVANPFGFILFSRNIETADQTRKLCADLRDCVGREAPIFVDQEGGRVQRLVPPLARQWAPPLDFVNKASDPYQAMFLRFRLMAAELRAVGIDGNCAPTLDIARRETHEFLRNRCYGTHIKTVTQAGQGAIDGMLAGGVLPVMKHMPGHGLSQEDSHHDLPVVSLNEKELLRHDFAAFARVKNCHLGMTGHMVFSDIDDLPTTLSPKMISIIRNDIGFEGLLMSDDINMKALKDPLPVIVQKARAAGVDIALHCNGELVQMEQVAEAAGVLDKQGKARAKRALAARKAPQKLDIEALEAQLRGLSSII